MGRSSLHPVDRVAIFVLISISTAFQIALYLDMSRREDGRRRSMSAANEHGDEKHDRIRDVSKFMESPPTEPTDPADKIFLLSVLSSKHLVSVAVNNKLLYESSQRGLHVCVLSQFSGALMAAEVFDTYLTEESNGLAVDFLRGVTHDNRVVVVAICDEGTRSVDDVLRNEIQRRGSLLFTKLQWRSMWAFASTNLTALAELRSDASEAGVWAEPVAMEVMLVGRRGADREERPCEKWVKASDRAKRRAQFCLRYEGYSDFCRCPIGKNDNDEYEAFNNEILLPLEGSQLGEVPTIIMASNRPKYLFRLLLSLTNATGFAPSRTTVYVSGFHAEPAALAELFGASHVHVANVGVGNGVIGNLYRNAVVDAFRRYPAAKYLVILEEDLEVSPDVFAYFSATLHLIESDDSIFSISAWNDLGYPDVARDPTRILRVEGVPGLGWVLKRALFEREILPQWPNMNMPYDWDMWLRMRHMLKGRESVIPEVPRTRHIGVKGRNVGPRLQNQYFRRMTHNSERNVQYKDLGNLTRAAYESRMWTDIKNAVTMVASRGSKPCGRDFLRGGGAQAAKHRDRVFFLEMKSLDHRYNWLQLCKCNGLWDLDLRGSRRGVWVLGSGEDGTRLFVVGAPFSPFA